MLFHGLRSEDTKPTAQIVISLNLWDLTLTLTVKKLGKERRLRLFSQVFFPPVVHHPEIGTAKLRSLKSVATSSYPPTP
ncbi:hypothetical protein Tco_0441536 [Tanacetum coccineum]